jgi:hypothetical protein
MRFVKLIDWRVCVWRTEQQALSMQAPQCHFRISEDTLLDTCDQLHVNAFRLRTPSLTPTGKRERHTEQHECMVLVAPSDVAMGQWIRLVVARTHTHTHAHTHAHTISLELLNSFELSFEPIVDKF